MLSFKQIVDTSMIISIFFDFIRFYCKIITAGREVDEWPDIGVVIPKEKTVDG